ncbi:MAG: hypothetical protein D6806_12925 [Deltaproteobacteria bacterium]|nr:MAG: hypothetical protein D6806_12925 [Deltaproteobacteria bacterium]
MILPLFRPVGPEAPRKEPGLHVYAKVKRFSLIAFLLAIFHANMAPAVDLVVVKSRQLKLFDRFLEGFFSVFKGSHEELVATGSYADPGALEDAVRSKSPKAILALGFASVVRLKSRISDIPIVFGMVPNARQKRLAGGNVTGVDMEVSPYAQLEAFRKLMPGLKKIGLIYSSKYTGRFARDAQKAASSLGLTLVAEKVADRKEVPAAFEKVISSSDAFWLIRDSIVMSRQLFEKALMMQFERRIPLLVQSPLLVKRQATCSYAATYRAQGEMAAQIVNRILGGQPPSEIPIQQARAKLTVNLNSASKAGIKLDRGVLSDPKVEKIGG